MNTRQWLLRDVVVSTGTRALASNTQAPSFPPKKSVTLVAAIADGGPAGC